MEKDDGGDDDDNEFVDLVLSDVHVTQSKDCTVSFFSIHKHGLDGRLINQP